VIEAVVFDLDGVLVDTDVLPWVETRARRFPNLELVTGNFGDDAVAERVGEVLDDREVLGLADAADVEIIALAEIVDDDALRRELEQATSSGNEGSVKRVCEEIDTLRWRILFRQDWFWRDIFDALRVPGVVFINRDESSRLILKGDTAIKAGKGDALQEVVRGLWALQPKDDAQVTRERALRSGLRKS